eukprot:9486270-Pyramimonas_sp.AAC.1
MQSQAYQIKRIRFVNCNLLYYFTTGANRLVVPTQEFSKMVLNGRQNTQRQSQVDGWLAHIARASRSVFITRYHAAISHPLKTINGFICR